MSSLFWTVVIESNVTPLAVEQFLDVTFFALARISTIVSSNAFKQSSRGYGTPARVEIGADNNIRLAMETNINFFIMVFFSSVFDLTTLYEPKTVGAVAMRPCQLIFLVVHSNS